jgi:hypothetical protein
MKSPPVIEHARLPLHRGWIVGLCLLGLAAFILWRFEPRGQFFYPRCLMYQNTGLLCPGCGGLRAAHALLNGDLRAAVALNPLAVGLVPLASMWGVWALLRQRAGRSVPNPFTYRLSWWALGGAGVGFTVVRNLPFFGL